MKLLTTATSVLIPVLLVMFSSCSTPPPPSPTVHTFQEEGGGSGLGGQVVVTSVTTNATVLSVDRVQRRLVLRLASGIEATYRAGDEMPNFGQIKVRDQVKATMVEDCAVSMAPPDALSNPANRVTVVRAPTGVELGPKPVTTVRLTAKILAFDYFGNRVTLQLVDGTTRTVRARENINLGDYHVGDNVSVLITEAMTIALEKQ